MIRFIIVCLIVVGFLSCSSKQTPVENLTDLTEEIKQNAKDYTEDDWSQVTQEYTQIEEDLARYHADYTDEELQEIGRLKGRYAALKTKYAVKEIKNTVENAINEAKGVMEGFANELGSDD